MKKRPGFQDWSRVRSFVFFLCLTAALLPAPATRAADGQRPSMAPENPAFQQYIEDVEFGRLEPLMVGDFPSGIVPPPVKFPRKAIESVEPMRAIPSAYDLRKKGRVTSVKDQGSCGSCWAFGTYGSLESRLMPDKAWNFSEENLIENHGFDKGPCDGGNYEMSTAYLARWSGPIKESDDPYNHGGGVGVSAAYKPVKHVADIVFLPERATPKDNTAVKQTIMKYGAVAGYIYYSNSYYDSTNYTYYYGGSSSVNHGVAIVGWDDSFSRSKFKAYGGKLPAGNGAFIVKNSYGTTYGQKGYFYVSYYDTSIEPSMAFNLVDSPTKYNQIFQYDPLGAITGVGYSSTTAWGANIFKSSTTFTLKAVGFHTLVPGTSYTAYVYKGVTAGQPRSGTQVAKVSGKFPMAGYHTVPIGSVGIQSGQRFSVVVCFNTPSYTYPVPVEARIAGYSSKATSTTGQGFISSAGSTWQDIYNSFANSSVCIKAMGVK
ncbi:MAG TPA: lectin like domain-containing protein [Syntrophobacteraceae bacterium]|nr:lectin like domain-containing protein [Syntrophobacteraceae bacterium]